jgi:phosphoglucosamine mutase
VRLLQHVHDSDRSFAELADAVMTTYPQVLVNVRVDRGHPDIASELADDIAAVEAELGGDGRVLLRASGTEPLVRVMVEAPSADEVAAVTERLVALVQAELA